MFVVTSLPSLLRDIDYDRSTQDPVLRSSPFSRCTIAMRNGVSLYTVRITAATQILLEEEQPSSSMRIFLPKATENVASIGESIMDRNDPAFPLRCEFTSHTYRASAYK